METLGKAYVKTVYLKDDLPEERPISSGRRWE